MTTLVLEQDPLAVNVTLTASHLLVELADGRSLSVPLAWYPRLLHGTEAERRNWQLLGDGYCVEWPDLDEHIGVEGLLAGRRSAESEGSFNRWLPGVSELNTSRENMKIATVEPLQGYRLELHFENGESGVVDLSSFVGKGVFTAWETPGVFEQATVTSEGAVEWPGEIDLCPDSLYLRMTGKNPQDIFPALQSRLSHA